MRVTVAIVEDNDRIREGLAALIDGTPGFACIATCETGEEALRRLPGTTPDVILMDIGLPGLSGIETVERLKEALPSVDVVMLTIYEDDDRILRSVVAGASGYILKSTPPAQLLDAIREVHMGGSPMSPTIARRVVEAFRHANPSGRELGDLSEREHEILLQLAKGYQDKEIAETLYISIETVRKHLRNIYRKLHVRSRTEALLKFLRH